MLRSAASVVLLMTACAAPAGPALLLADLPPDPADEIDCPLMGVVEEELPSLVELYKWFHANPELSLKEEKTAARFAAEVGAAGWTVSKGIGGNGVVAVLRNGEGPTVLARVDMDALPVKEETGLPYASWNDGVMHACGHDIHLAAGVGLARTLARLRDRWSGTAVLVGQPAEEIGLGAKRMLDDPKFAAALCGKPVACLALHDSSAFAAGTVAICPGWAKANVDNIDLTIFGRGGHAARPQQAIDPIVMAAEMILALRTLSSPPRAACAHAVVTVGSIQGGSTYNTIPDQVKLKITVRTRDDETRSRILAEIRRVATETAEAYRPPRPPAVEVDAGFTPALYNDPVLSERMRGVFERLLGSSNLKAALPTMTGDDFGFFVRHFGVPGLQFSVGAVNPGLMESGATIPVTHSSRWAPDPEPTIHTGVLALTRACLDLFGPR